MRRILGRTFFVDLNKGRVTLEEVFNDDGVGEVNFLAADGCGFGVVDTSSRFVALLKMCFYDDNGHLYFAAGDINLYFF